MVAVKKAGKTLFVKNVLEKNAQANAAAVNAAWKATGRDGTISGTLVQKMRKELGLTGNLRSRPSISDSAAVEKTKKEAPASKARKPRLGTGAGTARAARSNGAHRARPAVPARTSVASITPATDNRVLEELEADVDRLIFRVMAVGGLPVVEESLRRARRLLIRSQRS